VSPLSAPGFRATQRSSVDAFIGLGGNLGVAQNRLRAALAALAKWPGCELIASSNFYRSAPIDSSGPDYLNAVAQLRTTLAPYALLQVLQSIEQAHGRERPYPNAPRTLDLDLLLYGDARIEGPHLRVPHLRMWQRAFVLLPLAELVPERVSQAQLAAVSDQRIERVEASV
jgi:2-amino-4-hydroxy-6-hydroxymethyldihydropteridine diphosphokinase